MKISFLVLDGIVHVTPPCSGDQGWLPRPPPSPSPNPSAFVLVKILYRFPPQELRKTHSGGEIGADPARSIRCITEPHDPNLPKIWNSSNRRVRIVPSTVASALRRPTSVATLGPSHTEPLMLSTTTSRTVFPVPGANSAGEKVVSSSADTTTFSGLTSTCAITWGACRN